ncbi:hypothetical protein RF11_00755 [Thelohanellus kitauei]|uniref:Uncharacterized protein n=1 Tax=Thelohanellus kitauei TaxID=669202 RepID=A0A0C2N3C5_THEKT|nr:hypothetical protein RF11_00755 [Thelohanellus kitauei]
MKLRIHIQGIWYERYETQYKCMDLLIYRNLTHTLTLYNHSMMSLENTTQILKKHITASKNKLESIKTALGKENLKKQLGTNIQRIAFIMMDINNETQLLQNKSSNITDKTAD